VHELGSDGGIDTATDGTNDLGLVADELADTGDLSLDKGFLILPELLTGPEGSKHTMRQLRLTPQIVAKRSKISLPRGLCVTSGWNCARGQPRVLTETIAESTWTP
jgi:hypothetical protein